jgi:hypothetical protein
MVIRSRARTGTMTDLAAAWALRRYLSRAGAAGG